MTSLSSILSASGSDGVPEPESIRATLRSWSAELAPFPHRWRRAARVGFVTAVGAGVMAALQIANPLGLTLLVSFAMPELAFSLATGITFLVAAAAIQTLTLFTVGALVDSPVVQVCIFIGFVAVSTYLIYGDPRFGRLWLWIQIPAVTAFYLVLFDRQTLGWDSAQMFSGMSVAVALLWLFNNIIWPEPAVSILAESLTNTLARSRRRLSLLIAIFLGEAMPEDDRGVASKLSYHLMLLHPAIRKAKGVHARGELLAAVMVAERIDSEIDRLGVTVRSQAGNSWNDGERRALIEATAALESAFAEYVIGGEGVSRIDQVDHVERGGQPDSLELFRRRAASLYREGDTVSENRGLREIQRHLVAIGGLLNVDAAELPGQLPVGAAGSSVSRRFPLNKFMVRFCARHTVAMTIAFMAGLFDNNAALHAALWLLMIGGPPSHGATAKKFTVRAIGASGALIFAALASIVVAPNFTTIPPYMAAIFIGVSLITYVGEGGGELSFLVIGATAFVIAFSGPGPRQNILGSLWTIWGVSLGMIIRAVISVVSIERPNRTLAEEVERPLTALVELVPGGGQGANQLAAAEMEVIVGIEEMLSVAADAQLAGRAAGIDARNLVDALDTMRRLAFTLGHLSRSESSVTVGPNERTRSATETFDQAIRSRLHSWLASIRSQLIPGELTDAPLRAMVSSTPAGDLPALLQPVSISDSTTELAARERVSTLILTLERQLKAVSLS